MHNTVSEKKRNTSDAVINLLNNIYEAMNDKKYLGAVFLDLSKAFDTVPHDILLKKLEHYGVRGIALQLIESYLTNRKQFVSVNGNKSQTKDITIGVPQGSVLGPLLFLIYINDLPFSTRNMKVILFADDTTLFATNEDLNILRTTMEDDMQLVSEWLIANCLTLNITKTYYIIFTTKDIPDNLQINVGQHILERQNSGKFLGVVLDDKLTFKEHLNTVIAKVSKLVGLLSNLKKIFPLDVIHRLYYSLIYPHLNYCLLAWGSAKQTHIHPLIVLQKRIARVITDSSYYEHSKPLFKELGMLQVDDLYTTQCQAYMYETMKLNKHPEIKEKINTIQTNHSYETRNSELRNNYCRIDTCKQSIIYNTIKSWNILPGNIKNKNSLKLFKDACKQKVISSY